MRIARLAHRSGSVGSFWSRHVCLAALAGAWLLGAGRADADGCFVFHWDKQKDINEPTQKAIILHDNGREDMVLQVKYEGPAEDFGWLIPVPGLPEVRKGSMDCFYELSRLTQERFEYMKYGPTLGIAGGRSEDAGVKVIEVKTVGAYEVTVLSATNAASLDEWLEAHHFAFPKEKQDVLEAYVKKQWYFVAAKIDPSHSGFLLQRGSPKKGSARTAISSSTRKKLATGELNPLVISFPSETCVFPLAISAVNGKSSEVSLYVLSSEPLTSRVIFDKKFSAYSRKRAEWIQNAPERQKAHEERMKEADERREKIMEEMRKSGSSESNGVRHFPTWYDPADPPPSVAATRQLMRPDRLMVPSASADELYEGGDLVQSMEVGPNNLPACSKEMRRLVGKSWWLTKEVNVFAPEEMRDLEFEPAVRILAGKLREADGQAAALLCLSNLGGRYSVPAVLGASKSSNLIERRLATHLMDGMRDARLTAAMPELLGDADARVRQNACYATVKNWDAAVVPRLTALLSDPDEGARSAACWCLRDHRDLSQLPVYMKMIEEDGPAAGYAITLLPDYNLPREQLVRFFSSTNLPVVSIAFTHMRHQKLQLNEIEPLLTNSLAMARMWGLVPLTEIGDTKAVDRMVAMLRDPNEVVRHSVRAKLRHLTGQRIGADPAAWEKWWAENKNNYTPPQASSPVSVEP